MRVGFGDRKLPEKCSTGQFQDAVLIFVRAHCEANFPLYVEPHHYLVPCIFALATDGWMPVHLIVMDNFQHPLSKKTLKCMDTVKTPESFLSYAYRFHD